MTGRSPSTQAHAQTAEGPRLPRPRAGGTVAALVVCLAGATTPAVNSAHGSAGPTAVASAARSDQAEATPVAVPEGVRALLAAYERAWAAGDAPALARLFAEDGAALPNGAPRARGQTAITASYAAASGQPLALRVTAFGHGGALAYVTGTYAPAPGAPAMGKFVLVLREAPAGQWRIVADMDNTDRPPPGPGPAAAPAHRPAPP